MSLVAGTVYRLRVPMVGSFDTVHHPGFDEHESVLVVLEDDAGHLGVGTADPTPGYSRQGPGDIERAVVETYLPAVLADPPASPNALRATLAGLGDAPNARCAVETAALDVLGRRTDRRLVDLLGGPLRETVPLNGWVGLDAPAAMAEDARGWRDRGFSSVKIKLGGEPDVDVERVAAVCEAVADDGVAVRADVNEGYDVASAVEVARALEAYPLVHLEQPVPRDDLDGLARVTASTSTPIMADECIQTERDVFEVLRRDAADRVKVKLLRLGGAWPTRRALDAAGVAGVQCVVGHGFGLSPATSAELQVAAAHEDVFDPVESVGPLKMTGEPFDAVEVVDGAARLPAGPGLGVDLHEDALDRFATDRTRVEP